MAELYPWFVFAHLLGLVVFAVCHGVSMFVAFRVRTQRDRRAIAAGLEASSASLGPMYIGLLLLLVGGLGAAAGGDLWLKPWIIASAIVLIVVIGLMYGIATPYYRRVREAVAVPSPGAEATVNAATDEEIARLLDTRRPEALLMVGGAGLVVLLWLMVLKPG